MTNADLIKELQKLPPANKVKIAFDSNIRMDVDVAKNVRINENGETEQVTVITDKDEWESREIWD